MRTTLYGVIVGLLLFCGGALLASEADELRERAKAMRKEAAVMAERGNRDQAERLERESLKLLEAAERIELSGKPGIDKEVRHRQERLQDLLVKENILREANAAERELAEVREQIAGTERELHAIHAHQAGWDKLPSWFNAQAEKLDTASRRIHHLREAAQHLKQAEAHDLALQLMEKAEAMEQALHEGKKRLAAEMQKAHGGEHGSDEHRSDEHRSDEHRSHEHRSNVVRELKEENEWLRAKIKELTSASADRNTAEMFREKAVAAAIVRSDQNGDGKISKEESRGPVSVFERLDKNKNAASTVGHWGR